MSDIEGLQPLLTLILGEQRYAIPIEDVVEVAAMVKLERMADAPVAVLGLANRHGEVLPVLDMRLIFGLPEAAIDTTTLFVVVRRDGQLAGLVFDQVDAVIYLPQTTFKSATSGLYARMVATYEDKLYQILDIQSLMADYLRNVNQS